jgi:glucan phosphoethanolaminetransferase (alkaline phosphatase superfamily)
VLEALLMIVLLLLGAVVINRFWRFVVGACEVVAVLAAIVAATWLASMITSLLV